MKHWVNGAILGAAALAALATGSSALADVKAGVDAWAKGDYAAAVHEWESPATAGDPDAMFNLAQAYRLGRGVPMDLAKAEALYAKAAAKGHLQAADTYGLMLFQDGRHEAALPYVQDAARRGDPRSEYVLGIASFNGDLVPKDWVKAYALLSMANAQRLPQATAALAQMDQHVPLAQRQQAAGLALEMQKQAEAARGRELAAADLGAGVSHGVRPPALTANAPASSAPQVVASVPLASAATPAPKIAVSPSVAAALDAVSQASQATGTESPARAGVDYAHGAKAAVPQVAKATAAPAPKAQPRPAPTAVASAEASKAAAPKFKPASAPAAADATAWRVQLGAFSVRENVDKLWTQLSSRSELAGKPRVTVAAGAVTKLQAGGFASRESAETACRSLKSSGHDCLVTR